MTSRDAAQATALVQVFVGQSLTQVCVGVADAQLRFSEFDSTVSLWSPMRVPTASSAVAVDPYSLDGLALLLPLLDKEVTAAVVTDAGALELAIGGTTVSCAADPNCEAWSFNGPRGETVVCTPGGDLAIWSARR